jgi:hypothetical protein
MGADSDGTAEGVGISAALGAALGVGATSATETAGADGADGRG